MDNLQGALDSVYNVELGPIVRTVEVEPNIFEVSDLRGDADLEEEEEEEEEPEFEQGEEEFYEDDEEANFEEGEEGEEGEEEEEEEL